MIGRWLCLMSNMTEIRDQNRLDTLIREVFSTRWKAAYSDKLHDIAAKWGFPEIPGRPLVDSLDCYLGFKGPVPLLEEIKPRFKNNSYLGVFTLNTLWGCSWNISTIAGSMGHAAVLGFCLPHGRRFLAIETAIEEAMCYLHRNVPRSEIENALVNRLDRWLCLLLESRRQIPLF